MIDGFTQFDSSGNIKVTGVQGAKGATGATGAPGATGTTFADHHFGGIFMQANTATAVNLGINGSTDVTTTPTAVRDNRTNWLRYSINATTGGKRGSTGTFYADHGPYWSSRIRFNSDLTNIRSFFGWTNCITNNSTPRDFDNADTQTTAGLRVVAFRYSNGTDTGFRPITWDGTTQTAGTQLGTVTANTEYLLEIKVDVGGANATFYVTPAGGTRTSTSIAIGSACLVGNNTLNTLVPYMMETFVSSGTRIIDCGGCFWSAAGRND